jgi:integrase
VRDQARIVATSLLQVGVPMPVARLILGHSSVQITVDTYGHVTFDPAAHERIHRALARFAR